MNVMNLLVGQLGNVHQAFQLVRNLDHAAEIKDLAHRAFNNCADGELAIHIPPGIQVQLLDAKAETLVLNIDVENLGIELVTLLEYLQRILGLGRPRQVRYMNQTVDAILNTHEYAKIRDVANLGPHNRTFRI